MRVLIPGICLLIPAFLLLAVSEARRRLARWRLAKAAARSAAEKAEAERPDLQWLKTHRKDR